MSTTGCPVISPDGRPWGASQVPWSPFMDEETGQAPRDVIWPAGSPGLVCDEFVLGHRAPPASSWESHQAGFPWESLPSPPTSALVGDAIKTASHKALQGFCFPALPLARKP